MEKDWVKVFEDENQQLVDIIKLKLKDAGILPVALNEHATSFPSIGESEIYVATQDAEQALEIIRNSGNE